MIIFGIVFLLGLAIRPGTHVVSQGLDAWHLDNLYSLAVEQLDPIVSPNAQSSHMHRILGGNNFAAAYNYQELAASSCTTAAITVDHSSYWAPHPANPTTTTFLQLSSFNRFYYFLGRNDNSQPVQAWPEGFKMVAGNPNSKTSNSAYVYECHRKPDLSDSVNSDHFNFDDPCLGGIKFDLTFPSCWDGVNLYKSDQSHTAYPTHGLRDGPCPASHPIRLPSILLEYTYHPEAYPATTKGQNVKGHLIWANGDTTGYGLHADFMMGWDRDILTKALNDPGCVNLNKSITIQSCPVLAPYFNIDAAKACKPARGQLMEPYPQGDGNIVPRLPGCNPIWGATGSKPGCNPAVSGLDVSAFKTTPGPDILPASQQYSSALPDSAGWHSIGCYHDQALSGPINYVDNNMTPERCQDTCKKNGFTYAAVFVAGGFRCICDNTLNKNAGIELSGCDVACPVGSKTCGGQYKMDTYYQPSKYIMPDTTSYDLGCYRLPYDWASDNLIKGAIYSFTSNSMTRNLCSETCLGKGAGYSAVRDTSCYCGKTLNPGPGYYVPADMCGRKCGGNSSEICGDYYLMSIGNLANYRTGSVATTQTAPPTGSTTSVPVTTVASTAASPTSTYVYRGCIADGSSRVLNGTGTFSPTAMGPAFCATIARQAGKKLFGLEFGGDCYVGDSLTASDPVTRCTTPCTGENQTMCGGPWALSLYELVLLGGNPSITIASVAGTPSSTSTSVSSPTPLSSTPPSPMASVVVSSTSVPPASASATATSNVADPLTTYVYRGCIADRTPRVLNATSTYSPTDMSPALCAKIAKQAGKKLFALEFGGDCYVGDSLLANDTATGCTTPCTGESQTMCGGPWRMSLYEMVLP